LPKLICFEKSFLTVQWKTLTLFSTLSRRTHRYDEPTYRVHLRRASLRDGQGEAGARPRRADPARRSRTVTRGKAPSSGYVPRELLLAAAAGAVLAAFREPLEHRHLSAPATAALRLLETALEPYRTDPPRLVSDP
jgi:hypothetical protein